MTHRPIGTMRPVSSAIGTNWVGERSPSSGWCQRRSASTAIALQVASSMIGWYASVSSPQSMAVRRSTSSRNRSRARWCMAGSNISYRFLPFHFAWYMAVSASRIRPSGVVSRGSRWRRPRSRRRRPRCRRPRTAAGAPSRCEQRPVAGRSASSTSESMIVNSSPPSRASVSSADVTQERARATVSPSRTQARGAEAVLACPQLRLGGLPFLGLASQGAVRPVEVTADPPAE